MSLVIGSLFVMILLMGVLLVLTPQLMPTTECFSVTVPHGARDQEPLRGYLRSYMRWTGVVVVLCALAWPAAFALGLLDLAAPGQSMRLTWLLVGTVFLPIVVSYALMLHFRKRVQSEKAARGWRASMNRAVAFVGPEDFPRPLPLAVNLVYVLIAALFAAYALAHYDDFPPQIPMNIDLSGAVTNYVPKSMASVLFPVCLIAFFGIVFTLCHWGIIHSKKPVDPDAPASSALAYGRFARAQSIMMFVGGISLSIGVSAVYYASALEAISMQVALPLLMLISIAFVIAMLILSIRLGQAGARIAAQTGVESMARDDDKCWVAGTFYFNKRDPSIFVPKRFGIGWTCNMGRAASWALLVGIVLLAAGFAASVTFLMR